MLSTDFDDTSHRWFLPPLVISDINRDAITHDKFRRLTEYPPPQDTRKGLATVLI